MQKFDPTSPCLVLAPHFNYPLHSGDNILIGIRWSIFSQFVPYVDIVGISSIFRYQSGKLISEKGYINDLRPRYNAAVRTLFYQSDYVRERMLTSQFMLVAGDYLKQPDYHTVVFSLIETASILDSLQKKNRGMCQKLYIVETQNDQIEWFRNLRRGKVNPFTWLVSRFSERWVISYLKRHETDFLYLHLTEIDRDGYRRFIPSHKSIVAPVGVNLDNEDLSDGDLYPVDEVKLIFVGTLAGEMNYDALEFFKERFYPTLSNNLGKRLKIRVVGNNPSKKVIDLCIVMRWELYPNVTDEELRNLFRSSTFSILPFSYTTGAKIKLLESLAHGVPFMATTIIGRQLNCLLETCLVSDDPEEWLFHLIKTMQNGISFIARQSMLMYVQQQTWQIKTSNMHRDLCECNF